MKLLRSLFGLFVIVAVIYSAWKIMPPYVANYQLEEAMEDTSRSGVVDRRKTEDELRDNIIHEASSLHIDLSPEQVEVQRSSGDVLISADYTVRIDLILYSFDLHFQPMSKSKKRSM